MIEENVEYDTLPNMNNHQHTWCAFTAGELEWGHCECTEYRTINTVHYLLPGHYFISLVFYGKFARIYDRIPWTCDVFIDAFF